MKEMSKLNIKDKEGILQQFEVKDAYSRQEIDLAKNLDFNENQFYIDETNTDVQIKIQAQNTEDKTKFLKGDGSWSEVESLTPEQKEILEIIKSCPKTGTYIFKCMDGNFQWIEEIS